MPDPRILFILDARNLASKEAAKLKKDFQGVDAEARRAGGGIGSWTSALGGSRLVAIGAAAAVGGVILGLKGAAEAAIAEEKNIAKLDAALKANIPGWDGNRDAIDRRIEAGERLAFSDDEQRASLALLVGATKDVSKAQALQATAMDLARLKGIGLEEASTALIKVEGGQYRALKALGIQLRDGATATEALAAVQKVARGQAEAYADTTAGAMESLGLVIDDLQEDIGAALLPVIKELALWLRDEVLPTLRGVGDTIGPVIAGMGGLGNVITGVVLPALTALKLGLGPLGLALIAVELGVKQLSEEQERAAKIGERQRLEYAGVTQAALDTSAAMIELGQTPEAVAADIRESRAIMANAARTTLQEPIVTAQKTAQTQAKKIAHATPFEVAKSLREGSDPVKLAAALLKDAVENSLTPMKEIAGLQAELAGTELAKRLQSKRPDVVAAAQAYKTAIEERLYALRNGVPQIALDTGTTYTQALGSVQAQLRTEAQRLAQAVRVPMEGLISPASTWGKSTGEAYVKGIASGISTNTWLISQKIANISKLLEAGSPPGPDSPLHKIDVWGLRTGQAWTEGMVGGIDAAAVRRALGEVASEPMRGAGAGFGTSVSTAAQQGGFGPGGVPVSIPIFLDGRQIAEVVDEHLYYARAAAPT